MERHETPKSSSRQRDGTGSHAGQSFQDPHSLHSEKSKFDDTALVVPPITLIYATFVYPSEASDLGDSIVVL